MNDTRIGEISTPSSGSLYSGERWTMLIVSQWSKVFSTSFFEGSIERRVIAFPKAFECFEILFSFFFCSFFGVDVDLLAAGTSSCT